MKATDPDRFGLIERIEERLNNGETKDKVGRPLKLADEDAIVELQPEDELYLWLFSQISGAIPPDGTFPTPSEEDHVLDRIGIYHPENRAHVRDTVRLMCAGRAEGMNSKFEKPKPERSKKKA